LILLRPYRFLPISDVLLMGAMEANDIVNVTLTKAHIIRMCKGMACVSIPISYPKWWS